MTKRKSRAFLQIQHLNLMKLPGLIVQMCIQQPFEKHLLFRSLRLLYSDYILFLMVWCHIVCAVNIEEGRQVVRQEDIRKRWRSMEIYQFLKLCVCTVYIIVPMSDATGCWYEHKRCQSGQHVCMR